MFEHNAVYPKNPRNRLPILTRERARAYQEDLACLAGEELEEAVPLTGARLRYSLSGVLVLVLVTRSLRPRPRYTARYTQDFTEGCLDESSKIITSMNVYANPSSILCMSFFD